MITLSVGKKWLPVYFISEVAQGSGTFEINKYPIKVKELRDNYKTNIEVQSRMINI